MMMMIKTAFMIISLALGVGFLTLLERKILSYIQMRKGPNKVGMKGLPQPLTDAMKLFTKESVSLSLTNKALFMIAPLSAMAIMFMIWTILTSSFGLTPFKLSILFFLAISSLNVYTIMITGWSSNSKYSLLGAIRAIAQTISYEVSMALIILSILTTANSFSLIEISNQPLWFMLSLSPLMIMWMITCLAETNRAPFDLAEGESELVSGFNTEYSGGEFAFLFIAEYGSILLMSMITTCMFMSGLYHNLGIWNTLKMMMITYMFLWIRGSYPRMRYDTLMYLTWKSFLTISIVIMMVTLSKF